MNIRPIFKLASKFLVIAQEQENIQVTHEFLEYLINKFKEFESKRNEILSFFEGHSLKNLAKYMFEDIMHIREFIEDIKRDFYLNITNKIDRLSIKTIEKALERQLPQHAINEFKKYINKYAIIPIYQEKPGFKNMLNIAKDLANRFEEFWKDINNDLNMFQFYQENKSKDLTDQDWRPTETTPEDYYAL